MFNKNLYNSILKTVYGYYLTNREYLEEPEIEELKWEMLHLFPKSDNKKLVEEIKQEITQYEQ